MSHPIQCPRCQYEFEPDRAHRDHIEREVRVSMQAEIAAAADRAKREAAGEITSLREQVGAWQAKQHLLDARAQELASEKESFAARERATAATHAAQLAEQEASLRRTLQLEADAAVSMARAEAQAREVAREEQWRQLSAERVEREVRERHAALAAEVAAAREREEKVCERELAMVKREAEHREAEAQRAIEIEQRVAEERRRARSEEAAAQQARLAEVRHDYDLRMEEERRTHEQLRQKAGELQRKLEQKSQQLQGEAQEAVLRETLERYFPRDTFEDVVQGQRGGDVVQTVMDDAGRACGTILWESKRTQHWNELWIAKALEDQRERGASCAIIVSQALPAGVSGIDERRGVWVAAWSHLVPLAKSLRAGIVAVAYERRAAEGRDEKAQVLYRFVAGDGFGGRVKALVAVFGSLRGALNRERRSHQSEWSKREQEIEDGERHLAEIHGRVEGILGAAVDPMFAFEDPDAASASDTGERKSAPDATRAGRLSELILEQLPADGTLIGRDRVKTRVLEACAHGDLADVSEAELDQTVAALVDRGCIRRGPGRGGSLGRGATAAAG